MQAVDIQGVDILGFHEVLVDLLNSLSAVRALSEIDNLQGISDKQLVQEALNVLISNQDMERCSFFIKTAANELVNLTGLSSNEAATGQMENYTPLTFKMGEGVIGLAAQSGELQHCTNCVADSRFLGVQKDFMPGSIISVPVMALGELFGVLNISHPEVNHFSDWHIRLLEIYKNMLGQILSNFRLFQQMEQQIAIKTEHLQKALEEATILKQRFENLSMVDSLTQLYNRRFFYTHASKVLAMSKRYGDTLCMLLLDLDHFKAVNDIYGHHSGDQVLIDVAKVLTGQMRKSDIVARFGGEEFVVLFRKMDCADGVIFADRIREAIAELQWNFKQQEVSISVSIGMYCITQHDLQDQGENIDIFIHYADLAMYKAKSSGKNQVVVFSEDLLQSTEN
jgi:diguanylate cyclase (GGDEF)-like protein